MQGLKNCCKKVMEIITDRRLYTYVYILVSILWFFPLLGSTINPISKACFIWGTGIIAWDFFVTHRAAKAKNFWLIFALLSAYAIATLINGTMVWYTGVKHLVYNGISLLIIYAQNGDLPFEKNKKLFCLVNDTIIAISTIATTVSLYMFVFMISFTFQDGNKNFRQGFLENRLFGVFTSPNTGALFVVIALVAIVMNTLLRQGSMRKWKWYYCVCVVPQILYFSLTLSKGGFVTAFTLIFVAVFLFVLPRLYAKWHKRILAILVAVLIGGGCIFTVYVTVQAVRSVAVYVPRMVYSVKPPVIPDDGQTEEKPPALELERIETADDMSNGRLTIWQGGLAAWKQSPVFGIVDTDVYHGNDTPVINISEEQLTELEKSELKRSQGSMHNSYIQILVSSGAVGLLLFLALAFCLILQYGNILWTADKMSPAYSLGVLIFALLASMAANGMAESHLLYCHQDPYGILFWFFAGMGLVLFNAMLKEKHKDTAAFICDTPYQVMQAVRLVDGNIMGTKGKSDILIYDQFPTAKRVAEELQKEDIFNDVCLYSAYPKYAGIRSKVSTMLHWLFPRLSLNRHCDKKIKDTYGKLFYSFCTAFSDTVRLVNPQAQVVMFEDGLGTYVTQDLGREYRSGIFKLFNTYLLGEALSYHSQVLYLNQPKLYAFDAAEEIHSIPAMNDYSLISRAFGYIENDFYTKSNTVYLTQPLAECRGGENADEIQKTVLSVLPADVAMRVHPRQDSAVFAGFAFDTVNNLWELECAHQITDNHILVGAFSTAQFVPKVLFDREPKLIFTHRLFGDVFRDVDTFIERLRGIYRDPQKIVVVDTVEQLQAEFE